ncbi:MAG: PilN domain-containing protein [Gemmatimonadaceae bacterium]|nr:PilN domain-containing protein [Gemmatimonadaceae bacterium]
MLISESMHRRIAGSRIRSLAVAAAVAIVAIAFAFFSALNARGRHLARIDSEVVALRPRAATAEALQGRIARVGAASAAARTAQGGMDPLRVLAVLSNRLPRDVVVMSIQGKGDEWQITGTAKDASAIIPALDSDPAIKDVRFLAGTSRFTEGRRTYETFSVGFRASPST